MALPNTGKITPYDYQAEAYYAIVEAIRNYDGAFFIDASVGAGKTIIMAMIAARCKELGWSAMFLARDGVLVSQNAETIWECGVQNSIFCSSLGRKKIPYYPIIVASEGTIVNSIDEVLKAHKPRIIIIDECHTVNYEDDDTQFMRTINRCIKENPKTIIIGLTGSPYRGSTPIIGKFWKKCVYKISTEELVKRGKLVPTIFGFGHDDVGYEGLESFKVSDHDGTDDYSASDLAAMERQILKEKGKTQAIVEEVIELTKNRNAVMFTASGRRHIELIASYLPDDSYVIITDEVKTKERLKLLEEVRDRKKKYILQIGCLTTGFDESLVDTSVIMRKIRSLTLLIQLLGRGMRLLKDFQKEAGRVKVDHLCLDYTDTMSEMHELYSNPTLEAAIEEKCKRDHIELIKCPACHAENSPYARRCGGTTGKPIDVFGVPNFSIDGRCEFFWSSSDCPGCGTKNDKCATECRKCGELLKDIERNLVGKHYTDDDFLDVKHMRIRLTKSRKGVIVDYTVTSTDLAGEHETVVSEIFYPQAEQQWIKADYYNKFLKLHCTTDVIKKLRNKPAATIMGLIPVIKRPSKITHRVNADGKSIIHRKVGFV